MRIMGGDGTREERAGASLVHTWPARAHGREHVARMWPGANRSCAECAKVQPRDEYTGNQWKKGIGVSRCRMCVNGLTGGHGGGGTQTARHNNSNSARIYDLDRPFAQGTFRWVAKGEYTDGQRAGQPCVCKWFKSGCTFESSFYDEDLKASEKATHIIDQWNQQRFIDKPIQLNQPAVWTFLGGRYEGQKHLVEPFIENWEKFNSNSGWSASKPIEQPHGRLAWRRRHSNNTDN